MHRLLIRATTSNFCRCAANLSADDATAVTVQRLPAASMSKGTAWPQSCMFTVQNLVMVSFCFALASMPKELTICDSQAIFELCLYAQLVEPDVDFGTTTMNKDWSHSNTCKQDQILDDSSLNITFAVTNITCKIAHFTKLNLVIQCVYAILLMMLIATLHSLP